MAIQYVTWQDTKKNGTNLWYGRVVCPATVDLEAIAKRIEANCSMKQSDVLAYLTELIEVMSRRLKLGYKVEMGDIGTFYLKVRSKGALNKDDFKISECIKGCNIAFQPKRSYNVATGETTRATVGKVTFIKAQPGKKN